MTTPAEYTTPREPDAIDVLHYTREVVERILRNNPLTDAVVSRGLIKFYGNYVSGGGPDKINFLWIGEFFPGDPNIAGTPPQRGFSLVRDDSRGGVSAIAMYDAFPDATPGLKQCLFFTSGDGFRLMHESRDGGQQWPQELVPMGALGSSTAEWPFVTDNSPAWGSIFEGRMNGIGNLAHYRFFAATTGGCTANFRFRVEGVGGDVVSATHSLAANTSGVFEGTVNVAASRGSTVTVRWEGQRTNGVGEARSSVITVRCYTP